jgi:hypothetical protein
MLKYELIHCAFPSVLEEPMVVASFQTNNNAINDENLDLIFEMTQNSDRNWVEALSKSFNRGVVAPAVLKQGECRSTCVGDKIRIVHADGSEETFVCGRGSTWILE